MGEEQGPGGWSDDASLGYGDTQHAEPQLPPAPGSHWAAVPPPPAMAADEERQALLLAANGSSIGRSPLLAMEMQLPGGGGGGKTLATATARDGVLPGGIGPRERTYMVALFSLTAALLYADQNLMAPNLTAIATDFGFDSQQRDRMLGGYIAAAFYMVGECGGGRSACKRCPCLRCTNPTFPHYCTSILE